MAEEEGVEKHLTESTLHKENVLERCHRSVWGSWYDKDAKKWGYACCKGTVKNVECPMKGEVQEENEDFKLKRKVYSDDDCSEPSSRSGSEERELRKAEDYVLDWSDPPAELKPREAFKKPGDFIEHFVRYLIGQWAKEEEAGFPSFPDMEKARFKKSMKECQDGITPLIRRIRKGSSLQRGEERNKKFKSRETRTSMEGKHVKELNVMESLEKMSSFASVKNYRKAHEIYMKLTLGNKMWNNTLVQHVSACTMKGAREYRRNRDSLNTYDSDPVSQRYMHNMKKLCSFLQGQKPNMEDHSMNVIF